MPIYAYRCESCGHAQDTLQKMSDPLLTVCPACGKDSYKKQLTAAGFQLKGSGWYATDFRNSGAPAAAAPAAAAAAPATASEPASGGSSSDKGSSGDGGTAASGSSSCSSSCACH